MDGRAYKLMCTLLEKSFPHIFYQRLQKLYQKSTFHKESNALEEFHGITRRARETIVDYILRLEMERHKLSVRFQKNVSDAEMVGKLRKALTGTLLQVYNSTLASPEASWESIREAIFDNEDFDDWIKDHENAHASLDQQGGFGARQRSRSRSGSHRYSDSERSRSRSPYNHGRKVHFPRSAGAASRTSFSPFRDRSAIKGRYKGGQHASTHVQQRWEQRSPQRVMRGTTRFQRDCDQRHTRSFSPGNGHRSGKWPTSDESMRNRGRGHKHKFARGYRQHHANVVQCVRDDDGNLVEIDNVSYDNDTGVSDNDYQSYDDDVVSHIDGTPDTHVSNNDVQTLVNNSVRDGGFVQPRSAPNVTGSANAVINSVRFDALPLREESAFCAHPVSVPPSTSKMLHMNDRLCLVDYTSDTNDIEQSHTEVIGSCHVCMITPDDDTPEQYAKRPRSSSMSDRSVGSRVSHTPPTVPHVLRCPTTLAYVSENFGCQRPMSLVPLPPPHILTVYTSNDDYQEFSLHNMLQPIDES